VTTFFSQASKPPFDENSPCRCETEAFTPRTHRPIPGNLPARDLPCLSAGLLPVGLLALDRKHG
jgi:hypothetical protein